MKHLSAYLHHCEEPCRGDEAIYDSRLLRPFLEPCLAMTVRCVTARQMREIDRRAIEEFGIPSYELMERAGRGVSKKAAELAGAPPRKILVLAGKGNNGGDGLVAARYLHEKGYWVQVLLFSEGKKIKADPARNFA